MTLRLPVEGTLDNRNVVIVSAEEYTRFRDWQSRGMPAIKNAPAEALADRPPVQPELSADDILEELVGGRGRVPRVLKDREVAHFLIARLGTKLDVLVHSDCIERFGQARAPSKGGFWRFAMSVRKVREDARRRARDGRTAR